VTNGGPVGGPVGGAVGGPANGGAAPVKGPAPTFLTVPANPTPPKVEGVRATPPGPVGGLTAFNVGVQTPVANAQLSSVLNESNRPVLRSPKFDE
jgi:hypothetical protein